MNNGWIFIVEGKYEGRNIKIEKSYEDDDSFRLTSNQYGDVDSTNVYANGESSIISPYSNGDLIEDYFENLNELKISLNDLGFNDDGIYKDTHL